MFITQLGKKKKAKECYEKGLAIKIEIGDRSGEASFYGNLGNTYLSVGEFEKAKEYLEKAIAIQKEIGDKEGEACSYGNLGSVFKSVGEIHKAKEFLEKALTIQLEIRDKKGEASSYQVLGTLLQFLGEYDKASEYHEKALALTSEIGDRRGEQVAYCNLGALSLSLSKHEDAYEYVQKALSISKEIGDREGEAACHGNLGSLCQNLGDFVKASEYYEKALAINKDICGSAGEAIHYANMGTVFECLGEYAKAEGYLKKGLAICEKNGEAGKQVTFLSNLAAVKFSQGNTHDAVLYLLSSIEKYESLRNSLQDNDQFKISFADQHVLPYWVMCKLLCSAGSIIEALYFLELGRARALADLMSAQYSLENHISANLQSFTCFESFRKDNINATCLYISHSYDNLFLWILKAKGVVHFRNIQVNEMIVSKGLTGNLDEYFATCSFRSFGILPEEHCEDRSLNGIQRDTKSCKEESPESHQTSMDSRGNRDLFLCYKLIVAPMASFFEEPEIIIVPERSLYNIPFAALPDEKGVYLSETFRIRVVPSLMTRKLILKSPADYHSQTGALIVGNPDVGRVRYKGCLKNISRLPFAENEAKMIALKLGVKPLLGQQATKQAVLQAINSVSLIHFAAHGNSESGEIALAPSRRTDKKTPKEEDYLLTVSDISKVQLRAKLVVLSCCHSGRGHVRAEGVVGIARAFLGSGARSVLVALWAIEDNATEQFMSRFYEHLICGKSASESLHEAIKWMRGNGYSDVRQWAPFVLIGDNVTFDFGKQN